MKVLITGATGLVGRHIGKALIKKDHQIFVVSRDTAKVKSQLPFVCNVIEGDLSQAAIKDARFESMDSVIHLMGESIGEGRWTEERKKRILDSRVQSTHNLYESLKENKKLLSVISASAIGYYGDCGDQELNEACISETEGQDEGAKFLEKVCQEWEAAVISDLKVQFPSARDVIFRTGVVLSREGGAFPRMKAPFQNGFGAPLGSGQQWMSWIHLNDLVRLYVEALESTDYQGIYNACSPHPVTNEEFTSRLASALGKRVLPVSVPAFALRLGLGEMASLVLNSQKVIPQRLMSQGFQFEYSEIDVALREICQPDKDSKLLDQALN